MLQLCRWMMLLEELEYRQVELALLQWLQELELDCLLLRVLLVKLPHKASQLQHDRHCDQELLLLARLVMRSQSCQLSLRSTFSDYPSFSCYFFVFFFLHDLCTFSFSFRLYSSFLFSPSSVAQ